MKLTKQQLKAIIKEELINEGILDFGKSSSNKPKQNSVDLSNDRNVITKKRISGPGPHNVDRFLLVVARPNTLTKNAEDFFEVTKDMNQICDVLLLDTHNANSIVKTYRCYKSEIKDVAIKLIGLVR